MRAFLLLLVSVVASAAANKDVTVTVAGANSCDWHISVHYDWGGSYEQSVGSSGGSFSIDTTSQVHLWDCHAVCSGIPRGCTVSGTAVSSGGGAIYVNVEYAATPVYSFGSAPVYYSNYVHQIQWTNDLGVTAFGVFFNGDGNGSTDPMMCGPGAIVNKFFTNQSAGDVGLYLRPYQGAPVDEYAVAGVSGIVVTNILTNIVTGASSVGTLFTVPPSQNLFTNQVAYFSAGQSATGGTDGATGNDVNQLGNALITAMGLFMKDLAFAVWAGTQATTNALAEVKREVAKVATNTAAAMNAWTNGAFSANQIASSVSGWESAGRALDASYNSSSRVANSNSVRAWQGASNVTVSGSENLLKYSTTGLVYNASLDLRPSQWSSELEALYAVVRIMTNLVLVVVLYWAIIAHWYKESWHIANTLANVGHSLIAASAPGIGAMGLKYAIAQFLTLLIAGFPTLVWTTLDAVDTTAWLSSGWIDLAAATAGASSATVAAASGALWSNWFSQAIPWGPLWAAIMNYLAYRASAHYLTQLFYVIARCLPLLVLFFAVQSSSAYLVRFDNGGMSGTFIIKTNGNAKIMLPTGRSEWDISGGSWICSRTGTNVGTWFLVDRDYERVRVWENTTTPDSTCNVTYDSPPETWVLRGFVSGLLFVTFYVVVQYVRGVLRMGFGRYSAGE